MRALNGLRPIVLALALLAAAGCSARAASQRPDPSTLVVLERTDGASMNPLYSQTVQDSEYVGLIFDGLTTIGPDYGPVPWLGTSFTHTPDGLHWTPYGTGPILGNGAGGEPGYAIRSNLLKVGDEIRCYYIDTYGSLRMARSSDGYLFHAESRPVVPFNALSGLGYYRFDSTGFCLDHGVWWMVIDVERTVGIHYQLYLFKSTDNAETFQPVSGPLDSLRIGGAVASYGSPRALVKINGMYHLWYLWNVPSVIWHAQSPDLYNWYPDKAPTLGYSKDMFGLADCNQTADTCIIEMPGGRTFLYYDGTDNLNAAGKIGVAIFPGTLEQYARRCDAAKR